MNESATPVLVGVAQVDQRIREYTPETKEPVDLMIDALRLAAADAGASALLTEATSVRVIRGAWPYKNPAKRVAEAVGTPNAETVLTPYGGNFVQTTVNHSCLDIQSGKHQIILICGGECGNSVAKARRQRIRAEWSDLPGTPDRIIGEDKPMFDEFEVKMGLRAPIQWYPIFETALRAHNQESLDAHIKRISELWAGFSRVAAGNPHAALRTPVSAEEIRTISSTNRAISYPYPKLMNSNNSVDMGAALILTNVATAKRLGIPASKWVFPHVGTDAHDTYVVSHRDNLYSSPAVRVAGRRALELAGMSVNDVDHVDVYSCFPVAVQVGASEIGLPLTRPLTVTGGLTFNGGPLNNYVMHSIARMAEILRTEPGKRGLITANGGLLTKHAFGVYSTQPPAKPYQYQDVQPEVDRFPTRMLDAGFVGQATIEGYVVMYGGAEFESAYAGLRTDDGKRTWAVTRDPDLMKDMIRAEYVGKRARVDAEHRFSI
jgi:acetyl-CoA C-acetyltransferase